MDGALEGGLLDAHQVAKALGLSARQLKHLIRTGCFPRPFKVGKAIRWPKSDLEEYMQFLHLARKFDRNRTPGAQKPASGAQVRTKGPAERRSRPEPG